MLPRTLLAVAVTLVMFAPAVLARPIIDFLAPTTAATQSQDFFFGLDCRVASKLLTPVGNGRTHHVRRIQVVMIGNGTASLSNFCVNILGGTSGSQKPGAAAFTVRGASSKVDLGATGNGNMRMWRVTFTLPRGAMTLMANRVFWLAPYVQNDDFSWWGFAHSTRGNVEWWNNLFFPDSWAWKRYTDHFNQRFAYRVETDQP